MYVQQFYKVLAMLLAITKLSWISIEFILKRTEKFCVFVFFCIAVFTIRPCLGLYVLVDRTERYEQITV